MRGAVPLRWHRAHRQEVVDDCAKALQFNGQAEVGDTIPIFTLTVLPGPIPDTHLCVLYPLSDYRLPSIREVNTMRFLDVRIKILLLLWSLRYWVNLATTRRICKFLLQSGFRPGKGILIKFSNTIRIVAVARILTQTTNHRNTRKEKLRSKKSPEYWF